MKKLSLFWILITGVLLLFSCGNRSVSPRSQQSRLVAGTEVGKVTDKKQGLTSQEVGKTKAKRQSNTRSEAASSYKSSSYKQRKSVTAKQTVTSRSSKTVAKKDTQKANTTNKTEIQAKSEKAVAQPNQSAAQSEKSVVQTSKTAAQATKSSAKASKTTAPVTKMEDKPLAPVAKNQEVKVADSKLVTEDTPVATTDKITEKKPVTVADQINVQSQSVSNTTIPQGSRRIYVGKQKGKTSLPENNTAVREYKQTVDASAGNQQPNGCELRDASVLDRYSVIVGSFSQTKFATSLIKKLKRMEIKPFFVMNEKGLYRLVTGTFNDKDDADFQVLKLDIELIEAWIFEK